MILKGKLSELSRSTIIFSGPKNKIEIVKYDYVDIGGSHERDCITSSYLSNFLSKNVGQHIAIAYIQTNMTNALGRETITIGNAPKHNLIIGIKDSLGKVNVDKELIDLKGNQNNPVKGCLRNLVFISPIIGIATFLIYMNLYTFLFMAVTVGGFVFFILNVVKKRKNLESRLRTELQQA